MKCVLYIIRVWRNRPKRPGLNLPLRLVGVSRSQAEGRRLVTASLTQETRPEPATQNTVTFPATYAAAPGVVCSLTSVPVPFVPHFTGRKFTLKRHLALLRVTPQAPRDGGMSSALRAKEEIVHPASFVPHSASFTNSPLSARVGGGLPPHRASAAVALRSPASLGGGADVSVASLVNIIA